MLPRLVLLEVSRVGVHSQASCLQELCSQLRCTYPGVCNVWEEKGWALIPVQNSKNCEHSASEPVF
jgi:hypothetical protein